MKVGVAGVVRNADRKILLVKTRKFGWELPGGKVKRREDLIAALKREIVEEAACDVEVGRLSNISTHFGDKDVLVLTYLCTHTGGSPRATEDSLDAAWFDESTALSMIALPSEHRRLEDALRSHGDIPYRVYREDE